jgi:putative solute:sodium symporter small subunit
MTQDIPTPPPEDIKKAERAILKKYWQSNLRLMAILLLVWAFVGLGCGVVFADYLNQYHLPGTGYPLGFWFAQQGSIVTFVLLILVYAILMNRLDRTHHEERDALFPDRQPEGKSYSGEGI